MSGYLSLLFSNPLIFLIVFPGLLLSITLHEFAHCWMTDKLGDPTPRAKGRLTLDPRAHLDLFGTLAILLTPFGWGKPAPYDPYILKNPVRDSALIAAAGPVSNLAIVLLIVVILKLSLLPFAFAELALQLVAYTNVALAIFNLIPIGPLDGRKILAALLPAEMADNYEQVMDQYGLFILFAMIIPWGNGGSPISHIMSPAINFVMNLLI